MKRTLFAGMILVLVLVSCNGAARKGSEQAVNAFYAALRKEDSTKIKAIYPGFDQLGGYFKSKKITITGFEATDDGRYEVLVHNEFVNGLGKKFEQDITLITKEKNGKYLIDDSRGMLDFETERPYQFAVKTGFIPKKNDLTDLQKAKKILESEALLEVYFKALIEQLRKEVVVENWGWTYGFVNTYADGKGTVVNRSAYDLETVKYQLSFVDAAGNVTQTDDGYLLYTTLKKGESKDFTTMTADIGAATKAYIQVFFDTNELLNIIYERSYKGNEYKTL